MDTHLQLNLAHLTYGIYVLTTHYRDVINGMIASWVTQISYEPPLVLVAIHPNRYSHELAQQSGCFALHSIATDQNELLARFKGPDPAEKFAGLSWKQGVTGCPVLSDCIGVMECEIIHQLAPGNHSLFIGKVVHAGFNGPATPLCTLDYEGCYLGKE